HGPLLEPEVSVALEQRLHFTKFSKKPQCSHRSTIFVGASSEENYGFAIEDTGHSHASPTVTLSAPSQPRLILPLLPNRGNISSRPLAVIAIDSAVADHIRSLCVEPVIPTGKSSPEPTPSSPATGCSTFRPHNCQARFWLCFRLRGHQSFWLPLLFAAAPVSLAYGFEGVAKDFNSASS
ncbi:hypothetical protein BHM03_00058324, partial [Ensete ventricosum]